MKISGDFPLVNLTAISRLKDDSSSFKDSDTVTIGTAPENTDFQAMEKLSKLQENYGKEQALMALINAENKAEDARDNLKVISGSMKPEETLQEATEQFVRLINLEGNDNTTSVQSDFNLVMKSLKEGENPAGAFDSLALSSL